MALLIILISLALYGGLSPAKAHTIESPFTVPFVIGSTNIPIGFIRVWNDGTNLYVFFEIDTGSYPDYAMSESHLEVSTSPLIWRAPGLWTYKHTYSPCVTSDLYTIPLSNIDGGVSQNDTIYLMAHASIRDVRHGCADVGSAYGYSFKGSFNYTIQGPTPLAQPMLSIVKTGPLEAYPGGTYLYTIVVTNVGNTTVHSVNVTDKLPNGVSPAHPEAPGTPTGIYDPNKNMVNWTLGTLGINDIVMIMLEVVFDDTLAINATLTNNATAVGKKRYACMGCMEYHSYSWAETEYR